MAKTKIQWATDVWNPITGCTPVSAGCDHCYARRMANRLRGRYGYPQDDPFKVTLHYDRLDQPLHWRKPRMIFVCSMGDLFHKDVSFSYKLSIFGTMQQCHEKGLGHKFIILTKRPDRMRSFIYCNQGDTGIVISDYPNIWPGVSVEDQKTADERIPILLQVPAAVRILSLEPMLGDVDIDEFLWEGDDAGQWVICGGETGPGARPMNPEWARAVRDQCVEAGVKFFFKSWGEWIDNTQTTEVCYPGRRFHTFADGTGAILVGKKKAGRLLDGKEWNQVPETG